ncbi:centrosomal protein of 162 kDa isoform X1 [Mauremys reevesii]|uniref:centrosomal protein of 162 kDa isoform X1 n=2 Tax=Mauremys reevesii TaxID=260615 RepID=UPI00193EF731|nr:centrosomal protein of 162 kDa isoform X1 [Mauremys reevesii]XP_039388312.1 centrosomal protein of 162 kDa isoform X1 [Mauremys reevesii]XP_039388313.1 centrosomal protein of 162 kDa isoform X1 [Mauremys reevesii]XP_039388314.1 centrosomal protein of 162 kDa isoform X1 [Mauremys reevesii]
MAHRFSKAELDEQFEQFLKESLSDDSFENSKKKSTILETLGQPRRKELKKKDPVPWWISEDDSDDGGMLGTNESFLKSQKDSHPTVEVDEETHTGKMQLQKSDGVSVSLSRDSLEPDDSVMASRPNQSILGAGLDTLEEQEEKERFFAKLEKGASYTIDYSRLNKELDSNDSILLAAFACNEQNVEQVEDESKHEEKCGNYSEDFEDETESNYPSKNEDNQVEQTVRSDADLSIQGQDEKTGMLAKVVLLDSQDSTLETQKVIEQQDAAVTEHQTPEVTKDEINGTAGISYGQTNSDIEALQQAYCHIDQSLGDTDEQRINLSAMENAECPVQDASQNNEDCAKNISTTESDLLTVEELMKPIRADSSHARGFDLEPVSPVKLTDSRAAEFISHLPFKEHKNDAVLEKQSLDFLFEKHSKEEESVFLQETSNEGSHQKGTDKNQIDKEQLDLLRQKILQDSALLHQDSKINKACQSSSWRNKGLDSVINKQIMHKSTRSTAPLHKKKSPIAPHILVRSSGYGKPTSPLKQLSTASEKRASKEAFKKPSLKAKSPPDKARQKETLFTTRVIRSAINESASKKVNNMVTSSQSVVNALGQQIKEMDSCVQSQNDSSLFPVKNCERELYLLKRVEEAEENLKAAHDLIQQLKDSFSQKEKEMENKMVEMKMQHDKELFRLSQENYVLQTKVNSMEELSKEKKWLHLGATEAVTEEKLKQIQKEIQDQENLLHGYQQENERLYKQVKELQIQNKKNEERMFKENQHLTSELGSLREQMDKNNFLSRLEQDSKPSRNQSFTELISELRVAQKEEAKLLEERKRLKQDKQALEVDLGQMRRERDLARAQIVSTSGEKSYEIKIIEESYKQEISLLKKRLQWYAENQELLDRDAVRLKDAKEEIEKLKLQVDNLRTEAGNQSVQQKKRLKDRAADAKKIQDLERQIKEMETILKRRHPNSLPALIYAAAAASEGGGDISAKSNTIDFLERRIKKLETELEGKDDEAKKSLRAMEQQFQKIKLQYEQRLVELEELLAYKLINEPQKLHDSKASFTAIEQELRNLKENHQITVKNLQTEIENLKNQNSQLELKKFERGDEDLQTIEYQVEQAHAKARLVRLNQELITKSREIQDLTKTVERLQKERRTMLSNHNSSDKTDDKEKSTEILKKDILATSKRNASTSEPFPDTLDEKIYQPHNFADSHISEVLQENARLKDELERLSLEMSQQRVKSQAALAHSESNIRRTKEDTAEYIAALRASHQREVEKILCQHAVEHSASKVAELNSKISRQEILIKHLQEQVNELHRDQEALAVSQTREEILQKEMTKLLEELREAKERQCPEMKHFLCLERKIKYMEIRHVQREQELQQIVQQTQHVAEVQQTQEVEKWKKLAQLKNQELEKFQVELDSILDVLRELQKQGVVIPVPVSSGLNLPERYWKM